jgi:hypothetical protein
MTSGYIRPEDQRAAEDRGSRRIITKPSIPDQLGEALAEAVHSRQVPIAPSQEQACGRFPPGELTAHWSCTSFAP